MAPLRITLPAKPWIPILAINREANCIASEKERSMGSIRDSIRWLCSYNKSSYIRFVYSQCHVVLLNCTEQNVSNQTLTQVSQLYVYILIRSWLNMPTGGHCHVICMCDLAWPEKGDRECLLRLFGPLFSENYF